MYEVGIIVLTSNRVNLSSSALCCIILQTMRLSRLVDLNFAINVSAFMAAALLQGQRP